MRQRFCKHRESCFWLPDNTVCFGEERQKMWTSYLCSCSTQGSQALRDLRDAFLCLSLLRQCPAAQESTECLPLRKSLIHGKADEGFGTFLGQAHLAAERMEDGRKHQGVTYTKGMRHLLRQGHCLVTPRQRLGRRAQVPQRPSGIAVTNHASMFPIEEPRSAVLLGI